MTVIALLTLLATLVPRRRIPARPSDPPTV
jgi:hypothetical protein